MQEAVGVLTVVKLGFKFWVDDLNSCAQSQCDEDRYQESLNTLYSSLNPLDSVR